MVERTLLSSVLLRGKPRAFHKVDYRSGLMAELLTGTLSGFNIGTALFRVFFQVRLRIALHERHFQRPGPEPNKRHPNQFLFQEKLEAIIVVDEHEHLTGLVSERDLVRAMSIYGDDSPDILVRDIMAVDIVVCAPDNTLHEALTMMSENNVRHLPVLNSDGVLVAFIGVVEVMRHFLKEVGCDVQIPLDIS